MEKRLGVSAAWLAATGLALAGCGPSETPAPSAPAKPAPPAAAPAAKADPAAARAEALALFQGRCVTCHGEKGAGDGPGSAAINPKPRNFQDPAWQTSVTDDHIRKIILYGGAAVGRSPMMPGNPDLTGKPAVVSALVEHVRSLGEG